ncbi:MAG: cellobiose phosphorylase [Verrucomicrobiota bacterium]
MKDSSTPSDWWRFLDGRPGRPATGEFEAVGSERIDRLYFPIANEAGMKSWVSPRLQGGPALSHNEYLGLPLTAEDLPHTLVHRGFWLVEDGREPFSLSALPIPGRRTGSRIQAGPGWFSVSRTDRGGRFEVRATLWCPADLDEPLEVMWVEVRNTSRRKLTFAAYAAIPMFARSADDIRDHRHVTALLHRVQLHPHGVTVCPTMSFDERGHEVNRVRYSVLAFGPGAARPEGIWATQESFLGEGGTFAAPAAVWNRERGPKAGERQRPGREALGGFRFRKLTVGPGGSARFGLVSGISSDPAGVRRWTRWARRPGAFARSLAATRSSWLEKIQRVSFLLPDRKLDHWLEWVNAQPILRRLYGNSYLPQFDYGRGGKGWRDLWQDCLALLISDPGSVRPMLLHNFGGVRIDGSNATIIGRGGQFIADRNNIPRTWMDHGAWPTYTTLLYVDQTGDLGFLLQEREYFRDPQLYRCRRHDPGWSEAYGNALRARDPAKRGAGGKVYRGTVFEHMLLQNLAAFFNVGEHNVCRLEGADWNDGLDMAPDRGESAAFSAFYVWNLERLAQIAERLAERGRAEVRVARELGLLLDRLPGQKRVDYRSAAAKSRRLKAYLDEVARDVSGRRIAVGIEDLARDLRAKSLDLGDRIRRREWVVVNRDTAFFNGYYDNRGRRVEGRHGRDIRMMLTSQVFPVMAGIAAGGQTDRVIRAVRRLLKDPRTGGIRLNTDFGGIQPALGRAFSFAYGEKENGAVFSHMAVMYAYALYLRRRPAEGREVWHALYRMAVDQRTAKIFPCVPEYFNAEGRGMYCFLTGSASWLVYLMLTQVFGVRGELGDLVIDPQLAPEDFGADGRCSIRTFFADRPLVITFENRHRLRPGRYVVDRVARVGRPGAEPLAFMPLPQGGIRLARAVIRVLPADRDTRLVVNLVPKA